MPSADQCPSHTRTPWGTSPHRCRPALRHLAIGLLLFAFISVIVLVLVFVIGHSTFWANNEDQKLKGAEQAGGIAFVMNRHGVGKREPAGGGCEEALMGCKFEELSNFCCPHDTVCQDNAFSPSEISYCPVDSTRNLDVPPSCVEGTAPCSASIGRGCCPDCSAYSVDGCVKSFLAPPRLNFGAAEAMAKAGIPTSLREGPRRIESSKIATHAGPKIGELASVLDKDDDEREDEEASSVTFVKGNESGRTRRTSSPNSTNQLWNSQSSNALLSEWTDIIIPALLLDAFFLLR